MKAKKVSETGYGVDVAVCRADDLDKLLLAAVEEMESSTVLDLGCGAGGAAARLITAGAVVTGVDQYDFSQEFSTLSTNQIQFIQRDIRNLENVLKAKMFDFVLCQRTIHYLRYNDAKAVLGSLAPHIRHQLFISFSGLNSDLGRTYVDQDKAIEARFARLTPKDQTTFGVTAPLCLYAPEEAAGLLTQSGYQIQKLWTSAFGNIKCVATPVT